MIFPLRLISMSRRLASSVGPPAKAITLNALVNAEIVTGPWFFTSSATLTDMVRGWPIETYILVDGGTNALNL